MKKTVPLRIGYFGDGPWAHDALRQLLADRNLSVAFVCPRFKNPDPTLVSIARAAEIRVLHLQNVNAPESLAEIRSFVPDLLISMSYNQIIRKPLLDVPPLGFINCHAGKLPSYRGCNILNWALINGEKSFGITVHFIDEGIDTGPIILQQDFPIRADDDYAALLRRAHENCGGVLLSAVDAVRRGRAKAKIQSRIHPVGFYCGRRRIGDETVDWTWGAERIHNFVRGVTAPAPGARTRIGEKDIAILKTALIPRAPKYIGQPGEVVGRDARSVVVKTEDSTIRILLIADVNSAGNLAEIRPPNFRIGDRLGIDLRAELLRLTEKMVALESRLADLERK